jgi:hypothetical protein
VNRVSPSIEWYVVAIEVRWKEDFGVPHEALARREVRDQAGWAVRLSDVDNGALLLGQCGAEKAWSAILPAACLGRPRW